MTKLRITWGPVLALWFYFQWGSASAWAQVIKDSTAVKRVETVTIDRVKPLSQLSIAVPMQQLKGDALHSLNSLSVSDALRYFSGIQLKDYGGVGGLKTINFRSLGTNHSAVFYNGLQIDNAQNGQVDLGKFSLSNLEEITLFAGQNMADLLPAKAYASASSLYLKTVAPTFSSGSKVQQAYELKWGDFGLIHPSATFEVQINPKMAVRLNAAVANAHGRYAYRSSNGVYDTTMVRQNGDIFYNRAELGFFYKPKEGTRLQMDFYHYASERGLPGAIVSNKYDFTQRLWDRNFFSQLLYEHRTDASYQFNVQAKVSEDYTRYIDPDFKMLTGFLDNRFTQKAYYISSAHQYQLWHKLRLGLAADYQQQQLSANLYNFAFPKRHQMLLALSGAYHTKQLQLDANILSTWVQDVLKTNTAAANRQVYSPSLMLNWQPKPEQLSFRAFYKSVFRLPTFNDLYYTYIGSSNLKPEFAKQFNFGATYKQALHTGIFYGIQASADAYYNRITDKIVAIPTLNLFRWSMVNLGRVDIKGLNVELETNAKWKELKSQFKLNYTLEEALDRTKNGAAYGQQIPYIPYHSGSFRWMLQYKDWAFNYGSVYTGFRYSQKANIPENYLPAWFTHDLSFHKEFLKHKRSIKLGLELNNIFDQQYEVVLNYPMPGRNARLSLQVNFN